MPEVLAALMKIKALIALAVVTLGFGLARPVEAGAAVQPNDPANRAAYIHSGFCYATVHVGHLPNTAELVNTSGTNTCRYVEVYATGKARCGCWVDGYKDHRWWPAPYSYLHSTLASSDALIAGVATLDDGVYGTHRFWINPDGSWHQL